MVISFSFSYSYKAGLNLKWVEKIRIVIGNGAVAVLKAATVDVEIKFGLERILILSKPVAFLSHFWSL